MTLDKKTKLNAGERKAAWQKKRRPRSRGRPVLNAQGRRRENKKVFRGASLRANTAAVLTGKMRIFW